MEEFFRRRNRVMSAGDAAHHHRRDPGQPDRHRLQLCAIGKARFFFRPGVPRELRRMLAEQVELGLDCLRRYLQGLR
jgi:hypothetical protein